MAKACLLARAMVKTKLKQTNVKTNYEMLFLTTSKLLYSAHIIYSLGQVWAKTNKTSNRL